MESVHEGALRELAEEAGIVAARVVAGLGSSDTILPGQLWHFVQVESKALPERWSFDTADDGGHRFDFFWFSLSGQPGPDWHDSFVRAFSYIRANI